MMSYKIETMQWILNKKMSPYRHMLAIINDTHTVCSHKKYNKTVYKILSKNYMLINKNIHVLLRIKLNKRNKGRFIIYGMRAGIFAPGRAWQIFLEKSKERDNFLEWPKWGFYSNSMQFNVFSRRSNSFGHIQWAGRKLLANAYFWLEYSKEEWIMN